MSDAIINSGEVIEGNDWFLTYRLVRADGVYVSRADFSTSSDIFLSINAYDLSGGPAVESRAVYTDSLASSAANVAKHVLIATAGDALLTDGFWGGVDDTGYNFFYKVPFYIGSPLAPWAKGGNRYRVEFSLELTSTATHGSVSFGGLKWATTVYVKPLTSVG